MIYLKNWKISRTRKIFFTKNGLLKRKNWKKPKTPEKNWKKINWLSHRLRMKEDMKKLPDCSIRLFLNWKSWYQKRPKSLITPR